MSWRHLPHGLMTPRWSFATATTCVKTAPSPIPGLDADATPAAWLPVSTISDILDVMGVYRCVCKCDVFPARTSREVEDVDPGEDSSIRAENCAPNSMIRYSSLDCSSWYCIDDCICSVYQGSFGLSERHNKQVELRSRTLQITKGGILCL